MTADDLRKADLLDQPLANDGPLDTVVVEGKTRIEIVAGTEGQEATIAYGDIARQRWRLLFTAPLDKESGEGEFANLDGLANASRLTWEGRRYTLGAVPADRSEAEILKPGCTRLRQILSSTNLAANPALATFNRSEMADPRLCKTGMFEQAVAAAEKDKSDAAKELKSLRDQLYTELTEDVWIRILSFKATGGVRQSDFLKLGDATVTKETSERTVWSAELVQSWYQPDYTLLSVGARYEKTAKPKTAGTVCPANTGTAPVTCLTGPIGAPEEEENQVLFVEGKYAPRAGQLGFAMSPRVSYEFDKSHLGVDVPIYLLQGKENDGGLRSFVGGIRVGWRDDKDEFIVGVFVGKPFKLMGD